MNINACNDSHQSEVSACCWAASEVVNMISCAYINETYTWKTRDDVNCDEYLSNICMIFNWLIHW